LLHLVGYLYYWQMGFNSVFKGLSKEQLKDSSEPLGKTFARTIRIPLPNIGFIYGSHQLLLY